ncbi:hypothetical protein VULLAG_LOCUS10759 [Vulpes lagopus]
MTTPGPQPQPH